MYFDYPYGATPLDADEVKALIPRYIENQAQLNEAEQENILKAELWAKKRLNKNLLTEEFNKRLHKEMFSMVWRWAGKFRQTSKNIGVDWHKVSVELHKLLKDTSYWIENNTYPWDELGARFHHRLVSIHCFANGNGRHARLMTDLLLRSNAQKPFTWGAKSVQGANDLHVVRTAYIEALQKADRKNFILLIEFVRS